MPTELWPSHEPADDWHHPHPAASPDLVPREPDCLIVLSRQLVSVRPGKSRWPGTTASSPTTITRPTMLNGSVRLAASAWPPSVLPGPVNQGE
jgi:hypothetical protein